jgi:DNA-binding FadR family transcriptional regulator
MAEVVARALLRHIESEGLEAGQSLPNERDALEWLGVSRGSLREGLRLLEAHGVVTVRSGPGGGPVVREADPESFASSTTLLLEFLRVRFGEVIDARIAFEPQIAEAAAACRSDRQLAELMHAVGEMRALTSNPGQFQGPYNSFHRTLAESTGNGVVRVVGVTFRKVWDVMHAEVNYTRQALVETSLAHRLLADAIVNQDRDAARAASKAHLVEYKKWLVSNQPELLRRRVEWVGTL